MLETGTAKTEITAYKKGVGMMGYGMHFNKVVGQDTPLHARAFVFRNSETGQKIVYVVCEMAFITTSVKRGVLKKLGRFYPELDIRDDNLLLSAQHTHSGPGGYSHYGFYNLSIPGFVAEVYQEIVEGILEAIVLAHKHMKPARMHLAAGDFEPELEVAFNRSIRPYLSNPDVEQIDPKDTHLAVDRTMQLLRIDGVDGEKIAAVNWFGVHTTSMHNDNKNINWDNKGYAADQMERHFRENESQAESFLGAFAQAPAGDITPNYFWDKKKKWPRGKFEDDIESAKYNGGLQFNKALEIYQRAAETGREISGDLDSGLMYVNFACVDVHPDFAHGEENARTGPACHGVAFFAGTAEGPGMPKVIAWVSKRLTTLMKGYEYTISGFMNKKKRQALLEKYKIHSPKHILVEAGERKVLATRDVKNLVVPGILDPSLASFKSHHRSGGLDKKPWTPQVLPLQIVIIGQMALVALPGEPTTVAGRRMKAMLEKELAPRGVEQVIIAPYSNAYTGYITTYEEYLHQNYEGGHTVFGRHTLGAFMTKLRELAREMVKKGEDRKIEHEALPVEFTQEELDKRKFAGV